ncbi:MAG: isoprenylcysteine carboxyl methyltransferase family protein [Myxococcota bacterium]
MALYLGFLGLVGLQRLGELWLSRRNTRAALARGGVEYGRGHFGFMKLLHGAFLIGCAVEVVALDRPFTPALGLPMLALAVAAQGLRGWCVRSLGDAWNARVVVVPGMRTVTSGPYRHLRHPNYLAVAIEGFAIPLVHGAWITALVFSAANAFLLRTRIRCEEGALAEHAHPGMEEMAT